MVELADLLSVDPIQEAGVFLAGEGRIDAPQNPHTGAKGPLPMVCVGTPNAHYSKWIHLSGLDAANAERADLGKTEIRGRGRIRLQTGPIQPSTGEVRSQSSPTWSCLD